MTLNLFISWEAWLYTSLCGVAVVLLYCKHCVMDGVSDKIAKPSLSRVVLLPDLGWAVSCPIMRHNGPQARVDHHRRELVRNTNQGLYPP